MTAAKVRADSFAAALDSVQAWALYDRHYEVSKGKWELSVAWAERQFGLARRPSRSAFFAWLAQMHKLDGARAREIRDLCDARIEEKSRLLRVKDETVVRSIKAEALDAGLVERDWEKAARIMSLARGIESAAFEQAALEIKERAQTTKEADLALAREKFEAAERRLAAVQDAVRSAKSKGGLTAETLRKIEEAAGLL